MTVIIKYRESLPPNMLSSEIIIDGETIIKDDPFEKTLNISWRIFLTDGT